MSLSLEKISLLCDIEQKNKNNSGKSIHNEEEKQFLLIVPSESVFGART